MKVAWSCHRIASAAVFVVTSARPAIVAQINETHVFDMLQAVAR